jgi:integrase/recombinase XerC
MNMKVSAGVDSFAAGSIAVEEYLGYLRSVRGVSELTLRAYQGDLHRFASYCENSGVRMEAASPYEAQRFIGDLSLEGISAVSVNRALSSIRGFYRWLVRFGRRKDNPVGNLRNLRTPKTLPAFLWEGEMADFADLPDTAGILWPPRDKALILAMYSAGLRISELTALSLGSLDRDLSGGRVMGKGGKERHVLFSEEAREAIAAYLPARAARIKAERPTDRLFVNRRGGAYFGGRGAVDHRPVCRSIGAAEERASPRPAAQFCHPPGKRGL